MSSSAASVTFDYGTAEGKHFKIGDKVYWTRRHPAVFQINEGDVYNVIIFDRKLDNFTNANTGYGATDEQLKKMYVCLERVQKAKRLSSGDIGSKCVADIADVYLVSDYLSAGGKRRTRRHKHRKAKKTRKSRSRNRR